MLAKTVAMALGSVTSRGRTINCEAGYFAVRSSRAEGLRAVALTLSPCARAYSTTDLPKPDDAPVTVF